MNPEPGFRTNLGNGRVRVQAGGDNNAYPERRLTGQLAEHGSKCLRIYTGRQVVWAEHACHNGPMGVIDLDPRTIPGLGGAS